MDFSLKFVIIYSKENTVRRKNMKDKKTLRKELLKEREVYTDDEIDIMSDIIFAKIKELYCFRNAETIMIYVSYGKELNTHKFIRECLEMGKRVVTPICNPDKTMSLALTTTFPEGFEKTGMGIMEIPIEKAELVNYKELDIIITPGLAFTYGGDRLGYGGGYYDRLFEIISPHVVKLCPSYDRFILDEVPTDPHDTHIDIIITPTKSIFCGTTRREKQEFEENPYK